MEFRIPFCFSAEKARKRVKRIATKLRLGKKYEKLAGLLKKCDTDITPEEYVTICRRSFFLNFILFLLLAFLAILVLKRLDMLILALPIALLASGFVYFKQMNYPRVYVNAKTRDIERNLIPALQDMIVQLDSGVPLYDMLVNIANSDYGSVSTEISKAVKDIASGTPQVEAIENLAKESESQFFRRVLWQISNGMKAGSDMTIVLKNSLHGLEEEQSIQLMSYGSRLNPIVMFYMLLAIIMPALGLTFLTIVFSMLNISASIAKMIFFAIFVFVAVLQFVFIGIIKTRRPSLL